MKSSKGEAGIEEDWALVRGREPVVEPKGRTAPKGWPISRLLPRERWPESELFDLRMFDYYDGWINIACNLSESLAINLWLKETQNGTRHVEYAANGHYYDIYPSDTRMIFDSATMDP